MANKKNKRKRGASVSSIPARKSARLGSSTSSEALGTDTVHEESSSDTEFEALEDRMAGGSDTDFLTPEEMQELYDDPDADELPQDEVIDVSEDDEVPARVLPVQSRVTLKIVKPSSNVASQSTSRGSRKPSEKPKNPPKAAKPSQKKKQVVVVESDEDEEDKVPAQKPSMWQYFLLSCALLMKNM